MLSASTAVCLLICRCVILYCCFSSSSCCSVSWQFWMRNRLPSSSCVKISSSCCGSLKYIGMSSPELSVSSSSSTGATGNPNASADGTSVTFRIGLPSRCAFWRSSSCCASHFSSSATRAASHCACFASHAARFRSCCRLILMRFCSSKYSSGVRASKNFLYRLQSLRASSHLFLSLLTISIACLSFLISAILSCFSLLSRSAFLIASCAFLSFSLRKASNLMASSSSISSLFFNASSFMCALCSSLRISSRFVSRLICTRNISRFLAMKSAMFSFSRRRSLEMAAVAAATKPRVCLAPALAPPSAGGSRSEICRVLPMRLLCVVFSHTFMLFSRCRVSRFFRRSSSRILKTSSSDGNTNGLPPAPPADPRLAMMPAQAGQPPLCLQALSQHLRNSPGSHVPWSRQPPRPRPN
mmetsp:Transcript_1151/g.3263  ORF Transcript_1151/g.3263 Transcript_1151/m.3263 type:complete len:413 (+) Transcript_1151:538-1776(+)